MEIVSGHNSDAVPPPRTVGIRQLSSALLGDARGERFTVLDAHQDAAPLVGIHPGSSGNACNLDSEEYSRIAAEILRKSDAVLLATGSASERKLLAAWPGSGAGNPPCASAEGEPAASRTSVSGTIKRLIIKAVLSGKV